MGAWLKPVVELWGYGETAPPGERTGPGARMLSPKPSALAAEVPGAHRKPVTPCYASSGEIKC